MSASSPPCPHPRYRLPAAGRSAPSVAVRPPPAGQPPSPAPSRAAKQTSPAWGPEPVAAAVPRVAATGPVGGRSTRSAAAERVLMGVMVQARAAASAAGQRTVVPVQAVASAVPEQATGTAQVPEQARGTAQVPEQATGADAVPQEPALPARRTGGPERAIPDPRGAAPVSEQSAPRKEERPASRREEQSASRKCFLACLFPGDRAARADQGAEAPRTVAGYPPVPRTEVPIEESPPEASAQSWREAAVRVASPKAPAGLWSPSPRPACCGVRRRSAVRPTVTPELEPRRPGRARTCPPRPAWQPRSLSAQSFSPQLHQHRIEGRRCDSCRPAIGVL